MTSIIALKQELRLVLGNNYAKYLVTIRDYFSHKHNRVDWEFDMPFLHGRARELHNQIMRAYLQLCLSKDFELKNARLQAESQTTCSIIKTPVASTVAKNSSKTNNPSPSIFNYNNMTINKTNNVNNLKITNTINNSKSDDIKISIDNSLTFHSASEEFVKIAAAAPSPQVIPISNLKKDLFTESPNISSSEFPSQTGGQNYSENLDSIYNIETNNNKSLFNVAYLNLEEEDLRNYSHHLTLNRENRFPIHFVNDLVGINGKELKSIYSHSRIDKKSSEKLIVYKSVQERLQRIAKRRGFRPFSQEAIELLIDATNKQLLKIITELIKNRKSFVLGDDGSFKFGIFNRKSSSKRMTQLDDEEMCVTNYRSTNIEDDSEQLRALEMATNDLRPSRYPSKIGPTELYDLLRTQPNVVPNTHHRLTLIEKCLMHCRGFFESPISLYSVQDSVEYEEEQGECIPMCTY